MPTDRLLFILLSLTGLAALIFALAPGLDLAVSGIFFDGSAFAATGMAGVEAVRRALWDLSLVVPVLALAFLAAARLNGGFALAVPGRLWGFVLALFLLAPGLLVNGILKAHWGRARPSHVADFGGEALFTPFWQITDQCAKNCSFVSGEGAGAMAMAITALAILHHFRPRLAPAWLRTGQAATGAMLAFVGWQRIAAGGHFLSDVVFSWLFTALVAVVLARALGGGRPGTAQGAP